jgi:phosphotransferase system enzyme I (PtsI)
LGAVGIGLYRTEFLFLQRKELPGEEEQFEAYRMAVTAMRGLPVTIRTVDIGADKALDRMSANELRHEHALNPALGLRAIRWSLSEPAMFRQQLRAILRASAFGPVRILIPMVAHLSEIQHTLNALGRARHQLDDAGRAYGPVELGAMVEVPSLLWQLDELFGVADFVSVGSNDLMQFMMAADRGNTRLAGRFDPLSPAFLRALRNVVRSAQKAGKPVTLCGEIAGKPIDAMALAAIGYRSLSMVSAAIGPIKAMIRSLELESLSTRLNSMIDEGASASETRGELRAWAEANSVPI